MDAGDVANKMLSVESSCKCRVYVQHQVRFSIRRLTAVEELEEKLELSKWKYTYSTQSLTDYSN